MDLTVRIAVLKETAPGETRVALTPETAKKFIALGATVAVESGAGVTASIPDAAYAEACAEVGSAAQAVQGADIVMGMQAPDPAALAGASPGAWVAATFDPFGRRDRVDAYAAAGYEALAMEFMPRITRAQSMDVLSTADRYLSPVSFVNSIRPRRSSPIRATSCGPRGCLRALAECGCRGNARRHDAFFEVRRHQPLCNQPPSWRGRDGAQPGGLKARVALRAARASLGP